jgi:hypothetical protein
LLEQLGEAQVESLFARTRRRRHMLIAYLLVQVGEEHVESLFARTRGEAHIKSLFAITSRRSTG